MNNMNEQFQKLVAMARDETAPSVNVAARVIAILSTGREPPMFALEKHWAWLAAFSSAVAASITVIAIISYYFWTNPLVEISETISWVMQ